MIKAICERYDIGEDQILGLRETEDEVIVVIDLGIDGSPKHTISKDDLYAVSSSEEGDLSGEVEEAPDVFDMAAILALPIREIKAQLFTSQQWQKLRDAEMDGQNRASLLSHIDKQVVE